MKNLPERPFLTEDFSSKGGGIDFLGLRWVGLRMVGRELIPEINNVTTDMGTFFLGAWIPWKFRELCLGSKDYTEKNYRAFREKVEVAISLTLSEESELERPQGQVRNRVGITQHSPLPGKLTFKNAMRKDTNSLYAAAIYGPSLRALGFIKAYHSQAQGGRDSLNIPIAGDDEDSAQIMAQVDASLKATKSIQLLASLNSAEFDWKDIRQLGENGLDPARYRGNGFRNLKSSFRRKLLPKDSEDPGYARTLTTRLLLEILIRQAGLSAKEVRGIWYTGLFENGQPLSIKDQELSDHMQRWSCFLARQHQRYAIELFLWCFENAINSGERTVEHVVEYWMQRSVQDGGNLEETFTKVLISHARSLWKGEDEATSLAWNTEIHGAHELLEFVAEPRDDNAVIHGLRMLAGWYLRMLSRQSDQKTKHLMQLGGSDRMSISWFLRWLSQRKDRSMQDFLKDIFSNIVFTQHMRIALARFDGKAQRLRFLLGDAGIEPAISARSDFGKLGLPWMPDRLDTLISLLCDCDVLTMEEGRLQLGTQAEDVAA